MVVVLARSWLLPSDCSVFRLCDIFGVSFLGRVVNCLVKTRRLVAVLVFPGSRIVKCLLFLFVLWLASRARPATIWVCADIAVSGLEVGSTEKNVSRRLDYVLDRKMCHVGKSTDALPWCGRGRCGALGFGGLDSTGGFGFHFRFRIF